MAVLQPQETLFTQIFDFLAGSPGQQQIIAFKPSSRLEQRLTYLMEQNRQENLTSEERSELDEFLRMNHFMNMLKIRARQKMARHEVAKL